MIINDDVWLCENCEEATADLETDDGVAVCQLCWDLCFEEELDGRL